MEERGLKQASDDGFMIGIVEEVIKIILLLWKNLKMEKKSPTISCRAGDED